MIDLEDVCLTLAGAAGPVPILRGATLRVAEGETVGVVGPSGSGKSTLLAAIAGLERPTSGRVRVAGADVAAMGEDALARFRRAHMGIVFQAFHLIPTMTAVENVAVPLELGGRADARERASETLGAVGLGGRLDHYPGQLSGGEQQRAAIARAVAARPRILLADEPTGNLDRAAGGRAIDLLFAARAETAATLVLITHDPALAARCGRVARMIDGRIEDGAANANGAGC